MGFLLLYNIYTHNSMLNGKKSVSVFKNGGQMLWWMELTEISWMNAWLNDEQMAWMDWWVLLTVPKEMNKKTGMQTIGMSVSKGANL